MFRHITHTGRLFRIALVLAKYDLLFLLRSLGVPRVMLLPMVIIPSKNKKGEVGERLAEALVELGPAFIKFGQTISTRPDLIGDDLAKGLTMLQDQLPPFSYDEAKQAIESEFGKDMSDIFSEFEGEPVAAASIAQVHFAKDIAGNEVAVKILRPGIEDVFARDIAFFYWLAELADTPKRRRLKLQEAVALLENHVQKEMDMRIEAAASSELRENFKGDKSLLIPEIYWPQTTRRILTMERIHGTRITDVAGLKKAKHDPKSIMSKASQIFLQQVLRDGFFHADMHPGNVFVSDGGQITLVDFGIMGRLDKHTRFYLAEMLHGFLTRDYAKVADVHFDAGYVPRSQSREEFAQACRAIAEPMLGKSQSKISIARLLEQLFKVTETFQMETQPQLLLLQKSLLLTEGIGRVLNPDSNMWVTARPYIDEWHKKVFSKRMVTAYRASKIKDSVEELAYNLSETITPDGIKLHPETVKNIQDDRRHNTGSRWIWWALLVGAAVFLSII